MTYSLENKVRGKSEWDKAIPTIFKLSEKRQKSMSKNGIYSDVGGTPYHHHTYKGGYPELPRQN